MRCMTVAVGNPDRRIDRGITKRPADDGVTGNGDLIALLGIAGMIAFASFGSYAALEADLLESAMYSSASPFSALAPFVPPTISLTATHTPMTAWHSSSRVSSTSFSWTIGSTSMPPISSAVSGMTYRLSAVTEGWAASDDSWL
jgi:hypothetical protein